MEYQLKKSQENIEILKIAAEKFGFKDKNGEDIKDYLSTRKYHTYLRNTSKIKGIKETQRYYSKYIIKIIDRMFREEIANYRYGEIDNENLLKYIIQRMPIFKKELKNELKDI